MAQWRKVVVSGSTAELNNISASGNIVPVTTDGSSLGTATHNFSDLFLDSGAVVNFDSSDVTLTHAANEVQVDGGDLVVEGTNKVGFGGAPSTDYIQKSTDVKVVAAADIILDPAGGQVSPASNDDAGLGEAGKAWSDLFLADAGVINFNSGNSTITGGSTLVNINVPVRATKVEVDSAADYIDVDTDLKVIAAADIILDPAGGQVSPASNDDAGLGEAGKAWSDLFLAEGGVINWDSSDMTLTQTADQLALAGGYLTVAGSITGSHFSGSAASTGSFGYLNVYGDAVIAGNLTFGDADTDTVSFGADIGSNLIPDADDTYDLGSATKAWQDLFLEGDITFTDAGTVATTAGAMTLTSAAAATWSTTAGALTLTSAAAATWSTSAGALTLNGTGGVNIQEGGSTIISISDARALSTTNTAAIDLDGSGIISINSSGAAINIGNDDNDFAINIGTQGERTITVGNVAGATGLALNAGTGGVALASTGAGDITINSNDTLLLDSDGVLELNTSGGAINIGTDGVAVNTTIGNVTGTTTLALNAGTGGIALASTGAGDITLTSTDTVLVDSAGVLELNSSAGAIGVGNDAVGQKISVGGEIVTRTEVELNAILVDVNAGTGGVTIDGGAASNFTTTAGDITIDSEAGSVNIDSGESATNSVRIVASHTDGGIDVDAGTNGINVDSTGAISIGATNATSVTLGRVGQTITLPGNVDVNGTVFTIDATNIMISESFATFCSGSNIERDGGFMVESSSLSTGKGFGWDASIGRWGVDHDLAYDAFEIGAESSQGAYFALVLDGTTYSHTTGSEYAKPGNIWIDGDDDIWIYT